MPTSTFPVSHRKLLQLLQETSQFKVKCILQMFGSGLTEVRGGTPKLKGVVGT
jgi:hypothetical protein